MRSRTLHLTTVAIAVLVAAIGGCAAPKSLVRLHWLPAWALSEPGTPGSAFAETSLQSGTVRLTAAMNETVSFCLVVTDLEEPVERPNITVAPVQSLAGRLDTTAFEIFRIQPVGVDTLPGWHIRTIPPNQRRLSALDALVPIRAPRGGLPSRFEPGVPYHFWVDVSVPKATNDGLYTTSIQIGSEGGVVAHLPVELNVAPIVLPDDLDVLFLGDLNHKLLFEHTVGTASDPYVHGVDDWRFHPRRDDLNNRLLETMRLLKAHGITPVLPELAPVTKVNARGGLTLDWDQYDQVVGPCLRGSVFFDRRGLQAWPIPPVRHIDSLVVSSRSSRAQADRVVQDYLAACARHFAQKGWLANSYWIPPIQAPSTMEHRGLERHLASLAKLAHPGIRVVSRGYPQDLSSYGWEGYVPRDPDATIDGWLPPAQFFDPAVMRDERTQGRATWVGIDDPPFSGSIHAAAPPSYTRMLGWMTMTLGAEALHLGCVNNWPPDATSPTPTTCIAHDPNTLVFPGRAFGLNEAIASVRLKRLRNAAYDLAYRKLLQEHQLDHLSNALGASLVAYAGTDAYRTHYADGRPIGWVSDVHQFDRAREIMVEAVLDAVRGGLAFSPRSLESTATWRRLMGNARRVQLDVDGCNVRYIGAGSTWSAELLCTVTITNRSRLPLAGRLRFAEAPPTWSEVTEGNEIEAISPNQSRRAVLTATADAMPLRTGGYFELPIELLGSDGRIFTTTARVSFATALPFAGAITIDGDLSDWPPGSFNMLGDFRLITGDRHGESDHRQTHPLARTIAFVMQDDDYLYIAFNSVIDRAYREVSSTRNTVTYDGLTPVGEDLMEVLIDPLNSGTRSPADLYHVVVKPSGAHLAERGIALNPPVGLRAPWAADVELGTQIRNDRWMVELRIPWSSFDGAVRDNAVWGLNLTRFDRAAQQYSNWSGAAINAYDPMSLGNVFIPAIPRGTP